MQVAAFSTPAEPGWRWRIVNYAGEMIEESRESFATIAGAVARGRQRLVELNVSDRSEPARVWQRTSHLRDRAREAASRDDATPPGV